MIFPRQSATAGRPGRVAADGSLFLFLRRTSLFSLSLFSSGRRSGRWPAGGKPGELAGGKPKLIPGGVLWNSTRGGEDAGRKVPDHRLLRGHGGKAKQATALALGGPGKQGRVVPARLFQRSEATRPDAGLGPRRTNSGTIGPGETIFLFFPTFFPFERRETGPIRRASTG